jgi:hypothetical protein
MRYYTINKIQHVVFDDLEEVPKDLTFLKDWRDGHIGDWVESDDGCVIQILRRGRMIKPKGKVKTVDYVGTCTGTFVVSDKTKMDTSKRVNIYSIGGNIDREDRIRERSNLSSKEELFVLYMSMGLSLQEAYMKAFPTNKPSYANMKAGQLLKTERIKTAMKEELKPILEELGISETTVLRNINTLATSAQKEDTRLKALFKLSDIMDLEDKSRTTVTQISAAAFQGFSKDQLQEAERPKEIKNKD